MPFDHDKICSTEKVWKVTIARNCIIVLTHFTLTFTFIFQVRLHPWKKAISFPMFIDHSCMLMPFVKFNPKKYLNDDANQAKAKKDAK